MIPLLKYRQIRLRNKISKPRNKKKKRLLKRRKKGLLKKLNVLQCLLHSEVGKKSLDGAKVTH